VFCLCNNRFYFFAINTETRKMFFDKCNNNPNPKQQVFLRYFSNQKNKTLNLKKTKGFNFFQKRNLILHPNMDLKFRLVH
jgi:hypothetical protein